jgi:uncharacterized protein
MSQKALDVESPCVRECVIDQQTGYCMGCWRTLNEISFWVNYTPEQKLRILQMLQERRNAAT